MDAYYYPRQITVACRIQGHFHLLKMKMRTEREREITSHLDIAHEAKYCELIITTYRPFLICPNSTPHGDNNRQTSNKLQREMIELNCTSTCEWSDCCAQARTSALSLRGWLVHGAETASLRPSGGRSPKRVHAPNLMEERKRRVVMARLMHISHFRRKPKNSHHNIRHNRPGALEFRRLLCL